MCAEEEDDVDAFDFFTAEPIGSAARDLEKQLEAEVAEGVAPVLAEAPVEGEAPVEAAAPAAILEPEPMEMEEEEDAFDFFTAEPIGSAARELEKMQEAAAAEEALAEAMDTSDDAPLAEAAPVEEFQEVQEASAIKIPTPTPAAASP